MGENVMPPTDDQLTAAFNMAMAKGPENLTGVDRDYYLIQDFILEWENGALTGYLYNRIPSFDLIQATIGAMRRQGLTELATILGEAVKLFDGYREPHPPTTWGAIVAQYDSEDGLAGLDERITQLRNYGLAK